MNECNCTQAGEFRFLQDKILRLEKEVEELRANDKKQDNGLTKNTTYLYIAGTVITIIFGAFTSYLFSLVKAG